MHHFIALLIPLALSPQDQDTLEPAPIGKKIESWYKITQNIPQKDRIEHVGYAKEVIQEAPNLIRRYESEMEMEVYTPEQYVVVSVALSATLNAAWDLTYLQATMTGGNVEVKMELVTSEEGRYLSIEPAGRFPLEKNEEIFFHLPLTALRLRQTGRLNRKEEEFPIFYFYPKGGGGKNTAKVTIKVAGHPEIDRLDGKGKARVTEVYLSGYPTTVTPLLLNRMLVDRYGRAIRIQSMHLDWSISRNEKEARGDRRTIREKGRRDPFDKTKSLGGKKEDPRRLFRDRTVKTGSKPENDSILAPSKRVVDVPKSFPTLRKIAGELIAAAREGKEAEAANAYDKFLDLYLAMRNSVKDAKSKDMEDLRKIKRDVETAYPGAAQWFKREVLPVYSRLEPLAREDDVKGIEKLARELGAFRTRPELDEAPVVKEQVRVKFNEATEALVQAMVRVEFAKVPLKLTGTVVGVSDAPETVELEISLFGHHIRLAETVPFLRQESYATINGKRYRRGDVLDGGKDKTLRLVLKEIARWSVTVAWPKHRRKHPSNVKLSVEIQEQYREVGLAR